MKNLTLIKKAVNIIKPGSTVLPILGCVLVMDDNLTITDLNTSIIFKSVGIPLNFVQDAKEFVATCGFISNPVFEKANGKLTVSGNDGEVFTYRSEDEMSFPKIEAKDVEPIGTLSVKDCGLIKRALTVVGRDELRPAMCCVAVKAGFVMATDAHCAIFERTEFANTSQVLIGKKAARLMGLFTKSEFKLSASETHLLFENEHVKIIQRVDDNKFPDLLAILPTFCPIEMSVDRSEFVDALKKAGTCANHTTRAVTLGINSRLTISSEDIVDDKAYKRQISCKHTGENITIALNARMLLNIISTITTTEIKFGIIAPNRTVLINESAIQMPVILNQHA